MLVPFSLKIGVSSTLFHIAGHPPATSLNTFVVKRFVTDGATPYATFLINLCINLVSLQDFLGLRFSNKSCMSFVFICLN